MLQAQIDQLRVSGGGVLNCEPGHRYECAQPLVFDDLRHVTILGNRSQWVYTGNGPAFVTANSACQVTWQDVRFTAAPGFTGHLVTTGWSGRCSDASHLSWLGCEFDGGGSARACLRLDRGIFLNVQRSQFTRANYGILGLDGTYSNVVTISEACAFYSLNYAGVVNAGESWTITGNGFEPLTNGTACAYTQSILLATKGLTFSGNWCGDITKPGGCWVAVRGSGVRVVGNMFGAAGDVSDPCVRFFAVQGGTVEGNHNQVSGKFLDFAPEAGHSRNVTVMTNDLGIGAVSRPEFCLGLRMVNNFGQVDV
jgi:hypothetical protein